jgi:hypothetical protein
MKINRRFEGDAASTFGNEEKGSVKQTELLYSGFLIGLLLNCKDGMSLNVKFQKTKS